ncbi:PilZ domain-containing protein, partial [bacterium]|nr:PilZ domain-containing protein [bacterium]
SGNITFIQRKIMDDEIDTIDKRQYMRFNIATSNIPVAMESGNGASALVDVSRGGVAFKHNGALKVGDIIPVHLAYGDLDINADVKIVSATTSRAGGQFVNLDQATANQILFLNILLEGANNIGFDK